MMQSMLPEIADLLADLSRAGIGLTLMGAEGLRGHGTRTDEIEELILANKALLLVALGEGNACRRQAEARLRRNPHLHRASYAAPNADGSFMVGVAVRLDDGGINSLVHTGIDLDPFTIARWVDEDRFRERAAIREYDAKNSKPDSELWAALDVIKMAGKAQR